LPNIAYKLKHTKIQIPRDYLGKREVYNDTMTLTPISIILPYGIFDTQNTQYKTYIDEIIQDIETKDPHTIIFCGGLTSKKTHISESTSVADYVADIHPEWKPNFFYEDRSITTPQNLEFAVQLLQTNHNKPTHITIYCDSIRAPKVFILALTYFQSLFEPLAEEDIYLSLLHQSVKNKGDFAKPVTLTRNKVTIRGVSLHRSDTEISTQIVASLEEVAALRFPKVDAEILALRRNIGEI